MAYPVRTVADIGKLIRAARQLAGLTQVELAKKVGANVRWVYDLEHGRPTIEAGRMMLAMAVLGITLEAEMPNQATKRRSDNQAPDDLESIFGSSNEVSS